MTVIDPRDYPKVSAQGSVKPKFYPTSIMLTINLGSSLKVF